jgi:hypothetical protein
MRWLNKHFLRMTSMDNVHDLEGYDELVERLLRVLPPEDVLRHYRPEERLAGLKPEERLAGLKPDEYIHHFATMTPEEQGEVVRAMSPAERAALRKQLDENS